MQNARILIIGANSDIALSTARVMAQQGANLLLASRNLEELEKEAANLRIRYGVEVEVLHFDARNYEEHAQFYAGLNPRPDGVVLSFGLLGDQQVSQLDFNQARAVLETNYTGAVSILELAAADFESRGEGFIVGISSVAGDRGRADNYLYGSAKAGLSAYLSGLRQRLYSSNIPVLTVKPGFVTTKMTAGIPLPKLLTTDPDTVGKAIVKGIRKRKNVIYVKPVWRVIMLVIKLIPEGLFKRMKF